jgi:hypothetical protein
MGGSRDRRRNGRALAAEGARGKCLCAHVGKPGRGLGNGLVRFGFLNRPGRWHAANATRDERMHLWRGQAAWHHAQGQASRPSRRCRLPAQSDRPHLDPHPKLAAAQESRCSYHSPHQNAPRIIARVTAAADHQERPKLQFLVFSADS